MISLLILLMVAGRSQAVDMTKNPFAQQKLVLDMPTLSQSLVEKGVLKAQDLGLMRQAPLEFMLPVETSLLALIDTNCAQEGRGGEYTDLAMNAAPQLEVQAFPLQLKRSISVSALSSTVEQDPCVLGVTENTILKAQGEFTNDPYYEEQSQMAAVEADGAYDFFWGSTFKIQSDVVIAILDSGVDYNHPDLRAQMWKNSTGDYGYDFENNDNNPMDDNPHGHGTHVAGLTAAAGGNGIGVSGVMGYHAKIMAVKVLDEEGSGTISAVVNGIRYAIQNGASVINLSLGGRGTNAALLQALNEAVAAGVVIVVAAGNDGEQMTQTNLFSPASYGAQVSGMLTVGSFDVTSMGRSSFSNYSPVFVEVGAPGSQNNSTKGILSTLPNEDYGQMRGTSMASPMVAGAAALVMGFLKTNRKNVEPEIIEKILKESSVKSAGLESSFSSGNKMNLNATAEYLKNTYMIMGDAGLESH